MKISKLSVKNYRTLENVELLFPTFYSAICGRNDSGKTNVVKAIRCVMRENDPFGYVREYELTTKKDFTKWSKEKPKTAKIAIEFVVDPEKDTGLHTFFLDYLGLDKLDNELVVNVNVEYPEEAGQKICVEVQGKTFEDLKAQEVLKRLQASRTFLFHSSTDPGPFPMMRHHRSVGDLTTDLNRKLETSKRSLDRVLKQITRGQQQEIETLMGRLAEHHKVALSCPTLNLAYLPYDITLGDSVVEIELEEWGSGTRNRLNILLTIFRAKQVAESSVTASKVTPIIIVEEPESFLHPSAQAEFGRILQDLSEELGVQLIVTTHSPYLLNQKSPTSNILLDRKIAYKRLRETIHRDTSGDSWMEPFSLALGIDSKEFEPWRALFFGKSEAILLVEGETDKEYFELLRDERHGSHRLLFKGEISPYNGTGNLKNGVLLKFIKERYRKIFITYDLEAKRELEPILTGLGFEKGKHFCAIGIDEPGKKNIEGCLPENITARVYGQNPDVVSKAMNGESEERKSGKNQLKRLILDEFKKVADIEKGHFKHFHKVSRIINSALA